MYDYVIVGAGSAGCALAARLTENPDVKVCLVEAGPADTAQNIHIPATFSRLFRTRYDWDYDSAEEPSLNGRRLYLPRGRVLGGTSSMNAMLYVRGIRSDFDGWGQPGWGFDEVLPYFKRSEDNERGESEYHATGGPLSVSDGRAKNPSSLAFVEAAQEAGYGLNDDFNGPTLDGFGSFQLTQRDGKRCSTAVAFLHPVLSRPNLTLESNLQVHRVLIENGRAIGVIGHRLEEELTIRAEREVVLCGGTYNSPQLLMLSGVGPAGLLSALDIPVLVDQQLVGQNLSDHALVPLIYRHSQPISMLAAAEPQNVALFMEQGRGPLTSNGPEAGGYARTRDSLAEPDAAFLAAPVMFTEGGLGIPTAHALSCGPMLLTLRSRGSVLLASDDPTAKPRIQTNFLSTEEDLETAVSAVRIGLEIGRKNAMSTYAEEWINAPESESDADLRDYARRYVHSIWHPAGTCAMGTVVDENLRVNGVEGLRVADVSVMPQVGHGNPNANAIMIGEKAADLLTGAEPPARRDAALAH
ncbi:GMC family oxidoreductase [Amycolatopsis sp. H20-H5]|uniref:GMC family oxidoreductase n=1 Tax=Amycolatopsis sp. H20-H5 TaxID=3046309 RepID=UPI002DB9EC7B|nr:GMC family oxidoreductase N-terminal domain-containing protein [Amycolatopsis sp. H20-H5]MEC3975177.1 GMC family oxidoreductase N-terminal domain-containing protein [Amycolatopsis sp. H20-H5]